MNEVTLKDKKAHWQKTGFKFYFLISALALVSACNQMRSGQSLDLADQNSAGIINGRTVRTTELAAASTVAIYVGDSTQFQNFCTGTLIQKDVVITAGHCIVDFANMLETDVPTLMKHISVVFGTQVVRSPATADLKVRRVKGIAVHPKYVADSVNSADKVPMYDVSLLKLGSDAPSTAKVVQLLSNADLLKSGTELLLAGFGLINRRTETAAQQLMEVEVNIDNPDFSATQFTYQTVDGKTACSGDSGGPAYLVGSDGTLILAGVTSWGDQFCEKLGAYTSIPALLPWIIETILTLH